MAESQKGRVQQSFLGEAAQRLYNTLDLDGQVSPQFASRENIIPVVIVGDGLSPGMATRRNRRWMGSQSNGGGGGISFRLASTAIYPLIIERFFVESDVGDQYIIRLDPGTAAASTGGTHAMLDRTGSVIEPVPGLHIGTDVTGTVIGRIRVGAGLTQVVEGEFMLNIGAMISFDAAGAAAVSSVTAFGRLF